MRLLVSVATGADARAAVEGGADVVDAKDPAAGPLGAVSLARFLEIRDAVAGARPLTAAIGDARDDAAVARDARAFAGAGAWLVKVGLLGTPDPARAEGLLRAAVNAIAGTSAGVVAVAYADADPGVAPQPLALVEIAARAGASGVLIDTVDKSGPGLLDVTSRASLAQWLAVARAAGLLTAVAGRLNGPGLSILAELGPDVAGVRGAAAVGGRHGVVSAALVRALTLAVHPAAAPIR